MKTTNKPNLDELFQSKKLDVPSDEFWDDFQDKVKERALSTVVQNGSFSPISKVFFLAIPTALACALAAFLFWQTSSTAPPAVPLVANVVDAKEIQPTPHLQEIQVGENVEMIASVLNDLDTKGYLNVMDDGQELHELVPNQNLYVHQTLRWKDEDSSFERHTIEEHESPQGDFAQFTF
uniref:Uncharacterized protein n=1 Tax=uncultured verrucomicrobium HF0130_25O04 TaxID=723596 RepID=E7C365_9BACT|nr:hypothetical protein [uncultured verrucomicrobium HF0130_25O04]